MTSKEALENIKNAINDMCRKLGYDYAGGLTIDSYQKIKQDLERLETLEKEKQYLKDTNEALNEMLLQATNEALEVSQENAKLKKAIEIIKEKDINLQVLLNAFRYDNGLELYNEHQFIYMKLTQQEYKLLKEVLG